MLANREPVSLRNLVQGTGVSTMAVYTYFDGMPGVWRAVRSEGFARLAERLDAVAPTPDAVRDLAALGAAYVGTALEHPALYRAMFDAAADLDDPAAQERSFGRLVATAQRARSDGRFAGTCDPTGLAVRQWASGHGLVMLTLTGVLAPETLDSQAPATLAALFVDAGDDPHRCRASVTSGWGSIRPQLARLPGAAG